ncbi:hypothetical protein NI25_35860 [Streptomyces sp. CCM_MD2014]|nr:hypothetical protein NI25_35860 [Streptomyces sp. CCM_MD2014]
MDPDVDLGGGKAARDVGVGRGADQLADRGHVQFTAADLDRHDDVDGSVARGGVEPSGHLGLHVCRQTTLALRGGGTVQEEAERLPGAERCVRRPGDGAGAVGAGEVQAHGARLGAGPLDAGRGRPEPRCPSS